MENVLSDPCFDTFAAIHRVKGPWSGCEGSINEPAFSVLDMLLEVLSSIQYVTLASSLGLNWSLVI